MTRKCTVVFDRQNYALGPFTFCERTVEPVSRFQQRPFRSIAEIKDDEAVAYLDEKIAQAYEAKDARKRRSRRVDKARKDFKVKVNAKRKLIAMMISQQTKLNIRSVAKAAKADFYTVKKVYDEILRQGSPEEYCYNHTKSEEDIASLDRSIDKVTELFQTSTDLKREHPSFSKKRILRRLRERGFKWDRLVRAPGAPLRPPPNPQAVKTVVKRIVECISDRTAEILYFDEIKLPLVQTPNRHWVIREDADSQVRLNNRMVDPITLTAIAVCSQNGFVGVQLHLGEVRGVEVVYFLSEVVKKLDLAKRYLLLGDNASWHRAKLVKKSKIFPFILYNVPYLFQANMVENAFSIVRNSFKHRPTVENLEAEAKQIAAIFFDPKNTSRFIGIHRNHLRVLRDLLRKSLTSVN